MSWYLFRGGQPGDYYYRMEKARDVETACRLAFGVVFAYPGNGGIVYKDVGSRSPKYVPAKVKQEWYKDDGWKIIGKDK